MESAAGPIAWPHCRTLVSLRSDLNQKSPMQCGIPNRPKTYLTTRRGIRLNALTRSMVHPHHAERWVRASSIWSIWTKLRSLAERWGSPPLISGGQRLVHCLSTWSAINFDVSRAKYPRIVIGLPSEMLSGCGYLANNSVLACMCCDVCPCDQVRDRICERSTTMSQVRACSSSECHPSSPIAL